MPRMAHSGGIPFPSDRPAALAREPLPAMCTLTLLSTGPGRYRLAMTRDERRTRGIARSPVLSAAGGVRYLAPRDADAGGSWIAADELGRTLCLLNGDPPPGGEEPAAQRAVRSRGELLLELVGTGGGAAVGAELRARLEAGRLDVRPFLLVVVEPERADVTTWRFDGAGLRGAGGRAPWIATSNGVDPEGVARARGEQFGRWLAAAQERGDAVPSLEAQLELHRSHVGAADDGALASFCLHRPRVASVSLTAVEVGERRVAMRYHSGLPCGRAPPAEVDLPCS